MSDIKDTTTNKMSVDWDQISAADECYEDADILEISEVSFNDEPEEKNVSSKTVPVVASTVTHVDDPQIRKDIKGVSLIPASGSTWDYEGHCEYVVPALGMEWRTEHKKEDRGPVLNTLQTLGTGLAGAGKAWADLWYYGTSKAISTGSAILGLPEQGLNAVGVNTDSVLSPGGVTSKLATGLEVAGISTGVVYVQNRNTPIADIAKKLGHTDGGVKLAQEMKVSPETTLKSLPSGKAGLAGQLAGQWWKTEGWKFGAMVALGQFRFFSNPNAFYDAVPGGNTFRSAVGPKTADNGLYLGMMAAGLGMASATYRNVVLNDPDFKVPENAKAGWISRATGQSQLSPIPAKGTSAMPFLTSLAISGVYVGQSWYSSQVSAQQRVHQDLSADEELSWGGMYNPANWDSRFVQHHTTASMTFNWGVLAPVWAALGPYTAKVSDLYAKHVVAPTSQGLMNFDVRKTVASAGTLAAGFEEGVSPWKVRPISAGLEKLAPLVQSPVVQGVATLINKPTELLGRFTKMFSYTSADISKEVGSAEFKEFVEKGIWAPRDPNAPRAAWIRFLETEAKKLSGKDVSIPRFSAVGEAVTTRLPKKARSVLARVGYGKKIPVTFNQIAWSIPIAIGISQFRMKSQGFDTKDSINGSANGLWSSSLMSQVSSSYFVSSKGYVSNWDYYFFNMFTQNNTVAACTQQSEMIYQSAEKALADYRVAEAANDPLEMEKSLMLLAYAYRASSGAERDKVRILFEGSNNPTNPRTGIGIDPDALLAEIDALGAKMQ